MARLELLVGHTDCKCGCEASVFRNKRGKLTVKCPNCSIGFQSHKGQEVLKKATRFISDNPAPPAAPPEPVPVAIEPESVPPVIENLPEPEPEKKPKFSLFRK